MFKRPIFTHHAKDEMRVRKITQRDVRTALNNADTTYPGTHPTLPTTVHVGTAGDGRRLCVVTSDRNPRLVVTSYWR